MEGLPDAVVQFTRSVRPQGLLYLAVTLMCGLQLWLFQGKAWADWPWPSRCVEYLWLLMSTLAVPYIHVLAYFELRAAKSVQADAPTGAHLPSTTPATDPAEASTGHSEHQPPK